MQDQETLRLKNLGGMLERRGAAMGAVALAVFLGSVVLAALLPNEYEAYTTLLVEPQKISERLVEAQVAESDLNRRLHLMTMQILSRPRLSRIIDDLKLYREESEEMTREEVIEHMREQIRVEPVLPELEARLQRRGSDYEINTFQLFFRHESPTTAAAVGNRLSNDFIEEHIKERVQVSGDTSDFIESELVRLQAQIQEVEARIAQVKAENPGRLPEDLPANQRLFERTVDGIRTSQRVLAEAQSDEAFYRQQALIASDLGRADPVSPERRLELLQLQLGEYLSRGFTEKHPDVIAARFEIAELRQRIEEEAVAGLSPEAPRTVSQQAAEAERRRAALRVAATREELVRLQAQADEIQARIGETPRVAERLTALEREYQHLFASYQEFSNKRLEAGVAANMERRQKGEQFRVLEAAVPPPEPAWPNRPLILVLGLLLGLALGAGTGVLLETADTSFHGPRDLQAAFRLPVLAAIPGIVLESDRAAQRRRRILVGLATAAIVGVVLSGSLLGYFLVNGFPGWGAPSASTTTAERALPPGGE